MKRWEKRKTADGVETHCLIFAHHMCEEEQIVCLFRGDDTGDWYTTSDLLNTFYEYLTSGNTIEHDAKLLVEEMVYNHYEDEMKYYQEILEQFDESE